MNKFKNKDTNSMKFSSSLYQEPFFSELQEHRPEQEILPGINIRQKKSVNQCQFTPKLRTLMQQIANYNNKNRYGHQ